MALLSARARIPPRKKRKQRPPIPAKITLEPGWRGDVGLISEDLWKDLFGQIPKTTNNADNDEEELPEPPVYHIAIAVSIPAPNPSYAPELTMKEGKWTILPVTLPPPPTSQFPALAPSTILFPDNPQTYSCLSAFKASLPAERTRLPDTNDKKTVHVLATDVDPVGLETIIIRVPLNPHEDRTLDDQDVEDDVRRAVSMVKILHTGDQLRLRGHVGPREAKVELCEPTDQGILLSSTKVVVLKDKLSKKRGSMNYDSVILHGQKINDYESDDVGGVEDDEDEDDEEGGVTTFFNLPSLPGLGLMSPTTPLKNGLTSSSLLSSPGRQKGNAPKIGRNFQVQPLAQKIPLELLHPRPKEGEEDEEARVYVEVVELVKLRAFSGDWVGICLPPPLDVSAPSIEASLRNAEGRKRSVGARVTVVPNPVPSIPDGWEWRPVKIYSLPDTYPSQSSRLPTKKRLKGKESAEDKTTLKPKLYLSPILLANLSGTHPSTLMPLPELHVFPISIPPTSNSSSPVAGAFPPAAREVTLHRIASPTSTDRALQPSLLLGLKAYFESLRRLVKKGDLIAVTVDEVLARSLFGEESGGVGEELLLGQNSLNTVGAGKSGVAGGIGEGGKIVAWFKVGPITSSAGGDNPSHISEEDLKWGNVVYVDPATTRMVQAGTDKQKTPPTIYSTWEYYLDLRPPPVFTAAQNGMHMAPVPLRVPYRYLSPIQRRLRELMTAATSPRAIHLNLPPIAILLTSTQRSIGKKTIAMRAAADVGIHLFHIDAYDIVSEGNNGDVKTEAFLRARVERALACGKENTVLLISHVEAFASSGAGNSSGAGKIVEVLKEILSGWRVVVGTTAEVDKLGDSGGGGQQGGGGAFGGGIRGIFTHELEVSAPDEGEREGLLKGIAEEKGVKLGEDVQLSSIAVKTAALVAGDLVDVVERASAAAIERVTKLARKLLPPESSSSPTKLNQIVRDLYIAGGHSVRCILTKDFETAVEAARRNFADSIGAPKIPNVSWDDVGGLNNVKSAVMETIQLPLERPELFAKGMKKRSGILFYGPPGTGKTLLAKAIATEFSLNFFSVKGPELLNMYIGESEANVRRVFQRARDARPCVVFFDELDSVAPKRGNQGDSGGVMDRIVSQLLAELDGMSEGNEGSGGVFVVGATNRPDLLDAALLRPGRFDKMLYLGVSDTHEKQLTILEALTRKFTLHPYLSLQKIAETLPFTYTGADLYALCSDAMLKAITRQAQKVEIKVKRTSARLGREVSTGWWFDHESTEEDVKVIVEMDDFDEARKELVGSVSAKELEHYERVRRQFELSEAEKDMEKEEFSSFSDPSAYSPFPPQPVVNSFLNGQTHYDYTQSLHDPPTPANPAKPLDVRGFIDDSSLTAGSNQNQKGKGKARAFHPMPFAPSRPSPLSQITILQEPDQDNEKTSVLSLWKEMDREEEEEEKAEKVQNMDATTPGENGGVMLELGGEVEQEQEGKLSATILDSNPEEEQELMEKRAEPVVSIHAFNETSNDEEELYGDKGIQESRDDNQEQEREMEGENKFEEDMKEEKMSEAEEVSEKPIEEQEEEEKEEGAQTEINKQAEENLAEMDEKKEAEEQVEVREEELAAQQDEKTDMEETIRGSEEKQEDKVTDEDAETVAPEGVEETSTEMQKKVEGRVEDEKEEAIEDTGNTVEEQIEGKEEEDSAARMEEQTQETVEDRAEKHPEEKFGEPVGEKASELAEETLAEEQSGKGEGEERTEGEAGAQDQPEIEAGEIKPAEQVEVQTEESNSVDGEKRDEARAEKHEANPEEGKHEESTNSNGNGEG